MTKHRVKRAIFIVKFGALLCLVGGVAAGTENAHDRAGIVADRVKGKSELCIRNNAVAALDNITAVHMDQFTKQDLLDHW